METGDPGETGDSGYEAVNAALDAIEGPYEGASGDTAGAGSPPALCSTPEISAGRSVS